MAANRQTASPITLAVKALAKSLPTMHLDFPDEVLLQLRREPLDPNKPLLSPAEVEKFYATYGHTTVTTRTRPEQGHFGFDSSNPVFFDDRIENLSSR